LYIFGQSKKRLTPQKARTTPILGRREYIEPIIFLGHPQWMTRKLALSIFLYILMEEREKLALDQELGSYT
jgi:hypothetical protein